MEHAEFSCISNLESWLMQNDRKWPLLMPKGQHTPKCLFPSRDAGPRVWRGHTCWLPRPATASSPRNSGGLFSTHVCVLTKIIFPFYLLCIYLVLSLIFWSRTFPSLIFTFSPRQAVTGRYTSPFECCLNSTSQVLIRSIFITS